MLRPISHHVSRCMRKRMEVPTVRCPRPCSPYQATLALLASLTLLFLALDVQQISKDEAPENSPEDQRIVRQLWERRTGSPLRYRGALVDPALPAGASPLWDGNYFVLHGGESAGVNYGHEGAPRPGLTPLERHELQDFTVHFARIAERANITYFLHAGSLLGAVRHHGIIPWDDEVDVYVNYTERYRLKNHLERYLPPEYRLDTSNYNWKICIRNRTVIKPTHPWSFPFLDIAFFAHDDNNMWESLSTFQVRHYAVHNVFNMTQTIFPLVRRPFMNMWLPTPKRPIEYLLTMYRHISCRNHPSSHRLESSKGLHVREYSCSSLTGMYPFVSTIEDDKRQEMLVFNGTLVHWVTVDT